MLVYRVLSETNEGKYSNVLMANPVYEPPFGARSGEVLTVAKTQLIAFKCMV